MLVLIFKGQQISYFTRFLSYRKVFNLIFIGVNVVAPEISKIKKKVAKVKEKDHREELLIEIVFSIIGDNAESMVGLLYNKKNVNEFLIAKKLDLTINQARNILYRLADEGIVGFIRKKDKKKGGWYTYFWTLNAGKGLLRFKEKASKRFESLKKGLEDRKTKRFYYNPLADLEYSEEEALENNFICPETGEVLELRDSSSEIQEMESQLKSADEVLKKVDEEIKLMEEKENKARERRFREEEKKKQEERLEKRKKKAREKARLEKKLGKKSKKVKTKKKGKVKKNAKKKKKTGKKKVKKKSGKRK